MFALIEKTPDEWHISTLLMSCRVFGRNVEDAFFAHLCMEAQRAGAKRISIDFTESEKNAPARTFIEKYFVDFERDLSESVAFPEWIQIQEK